MTFQFKYVVPDIKVSYNEDKLFENNLPVQSTKAGDYISGFCALLSRLCIKGGKGVIKIQLDQPLPSCESWWDYKDIAVLAVSKTRGGAIHMPHVDNHDQYVVAAIFLRFVN
jgi:hypothetical protein